MPLQLYKISSTELTATTGSVTFSNIPDGYTDLKIVYSARSSAAGATGTVISLSFNGSTANFSSRYIEGAGSGTPGSYNSPANFAGVSNTTAMTASTFSSGEIYIPNYRGSTNKSYSIDCVTEQNATGALAELIAGLWSQTAAITSITLSTSNFQAGSTFILYGIL